MCNTAMDILSQQLERMFHRDIESLRSNQVANNLIQPTLILH